MPHADSSLIPPTISSKKEFWVHVAQQLGYLIDGQREWIGNLANASSLIYNSLLAFPAFGTGEGAVNWCGFYLDSSLFPVPRLSTKPLLARDQPAGSTKLMLGPFCGRPACQFIDTSPDRAKGVCAGAYLKQATELVPDVEAYPGHIACDGLTKSEIVCPLILKHGETLTVLGVLDVDCLALAGLDQDDQEGLETIAQMLVDGCDW